MDLVADKGAYAANISYLAFCRPQGDGATSFGQRLNAAMRANTR